MTNDHARALEAVLKLAALEERSAELKTSLERIEGKLESLVERIAKLEGRHAQPGVAPEESPTSETGEQALDAYPDALPYFVVLSEE